MKTYDLYLQSGPKRLKSYVHVRSLRGCMLMRDTADEAIAAAPDAIRTYLEYLQRHGEALDAATPFKVRVAEERLEGGFLGGAFYDPDTKPLTQTESNRALKWLGWMHADLRSVTKKLSPKQLGATPSKGRPIARILAHVCAEGGYLRGVSGASRIARMVDQGTLDPHDGLDELLALEADRLRTMPADERREVRIAGQSRWSANAAVRRMLEHCWEHYVEICERLKVAP